MEAAALYLLSPLSLALWLAAAAMLLAILKARRAALVLAAAAFAGLWTCSLPVVADMLIEHLESQYAPMAPEAAPAADAILILGGAVAGARPPERPTIQLGPSSTRVLYAAALYRARKAPRIVIAGGNRGGRAGDQVEADAIRDFLVQLGVPGTAILQEGTSRTTRENATNVLPVLRSVGARRVLLVTSAMHMPRAMQTFVRIWGDGAPVLIPAVTDVRGRRTGETGAILWLPSLDALISVTLAFKEIAGRAATAIML